MTKVINFCAGPSAGKTTCGLELAGQMKRARMNVLYVPEFALELVVKKNFEDMDDQLYMLGEQHHRIYAAKDQFDFVVTDSPIFMQLHYANDGNKKFNGSASPHWRATFKQFVMQTFWRYDNITFFVDRKDRKFIQTGRIQDEQQSRGIDVEILKILEEQKIRFTEVSDAIDAWNYLEEEGFLRA